MDLNSLLWPNQPYIEPFGFKIYWYAIIIVIGMVLAFFVISTLFKRRNMSSDLFLTYFVISLPIAIITTRLFYCITDGIQIKHWFNFESIRQGGLSIVGGIIGGAASVIVISIVKKVNFFRVGDCVVVGLLLAQAIGRWGNFVNQEVYGAEVASEGMQWFPFAVYIDKTDSWHYAFFFYESMINLTAAILLFINAWRNGKKPNGVNTACYFIVYGLTRTVMEPLRDSSYILGDGDGIPWSMVMSICMLLAGAGLLFYVLYTNKKKEGKLIGSANDDPYGITKYIGDKKDEKAYKTKINMMCAIYPENYLPALAKEKKHHWWERKKKVETKEECSKEQNEEAPNKDAEEKE